MADFQASGEIARRVWPEVPLDVIDSESRAETRVANSAVNWLGYWGLRLDPFLGSRAGYVPLPSHEEAIARLSYLVEAGYASGVLSGESGLGKSTVWNQLQQRLRSPGRRFAQVVHPTCGSEIVSAVTTATGLLGSRPAQASGGGRQMLENAARLQNWQQIHLILMVDGCRELLEGAETSELKRMLNLGSQGKPRFTVILATDDASTVQAHPEFRDALPARLKRLTRSEAVAYLASKLQMAGRNENDEVFTPRAITKLHAASEGIPRTLDRIALLALMSGAARGLEMITPEIVEESRGEPYLH